MGQIKLLDCTLRDGGYINDWNFGEDAIKGTIEKLSMTKIEMIEVGFLKGENYDCNKSLFPTIVSIDNVVPAKSNAIMYLAMLDMNCPIDKKYIIPASESSVEGIRVIFKKNKIDEAYDYCEFISKLGYKVFVNFVNTEQYSNDELKIYIEKFENINPCAMTIVDTFGLLKKKQFLEIVKVFDDCMSNGVMLGYHSHNNLQQAFGNAEAFVELNLQRDIYIDACVFGMGRGAGNLNLEIFAEHLNENYDKNYQIEPMLEIMDEYLSEIYKEKFWGYSLPLYLSARHGCHPNYAIYLAEKHSLTEKMFDELLSYISNEDKLIYSKEKAELYYQQYMENFVDDKQIIDELRKIFSNKDILLLAPGNSLNKYFDEINAIKETKDTIVVAVNFLAEQFVPDFIFSSNMRRYIKIQGKTNAKCITTSNMRDCNITDYVINFSSFSLTEPEIIDNSGLMLLNLLAKLNVNKVYIAGMDGYSSNLNYYDELLEYDFSKESKNRNELISNEINVLSKKLSIEFITPSSYVIGG